MNLNRIKDHTRMTHAEMAVLLRADPVTGTLWWLAESGRTGRADRVPQSKCGYAHVVVQGHTYAAHRVLWLLCTGNWPQFVIDHINGDRHDNRLANLRDVTHAENQLNQSFHRDGSRKPDSRRLTLVKTKSERGLTFKVLALEMAKAGLP